MAFLFFDDFNIVLWNHASLRIVGHAFFAISKKPTIIIVAQKLWTLQVPHRFVYYYHNLLQKLTESTIFDLQFLAF